MWEFRLVELSVYYSCPFIDIRLITNPIFESIYYIIHILVWLSEWGGGQHLGRAWAPSHHSEALYVL
jgi:hypothetical protein